MKKRLEVGDEDKNAKIITAMQKGIEEPDKWTRDQFRTSIIHCLLRHEVVKADAYRVDSITDPRHKLRQYPPGSRGDFSRKRKVLEMPRLS